MPCCNKKPRIRLDPGPVIHPDPNWNDNGCSAGQARNYQWRFFRNGQLVYATGFELPATVLPIGIGSTYGALNATASQIQAFLEAQGATFQSGDYIDIEVRVRNCQNQIGASNRIRIVASTGGNGGGNTGCDCVLLTASATGQLGNNAALPGGITGTAGLLVFRNGLLNYEGADFTGEPLLSDDQLLFATLTGCDGTMVTAEVTGKTGTVTVPGAFAALPTADYLVFRNGAAVRAFTITGGELLVTGEAASELSDRWLFVQISGTTGGCTFHRVLVNANATGSTIVLPGGYTAANQNKWLLVRGPLVQSAGVGYTVSGSTVSLTTPASGETFWLIVID